MMRFSKKRLEMGEEAWCEYQKERINKKSYVYQKRNIACVIKCRRNNKLKLIQALGGKCEICGYNKQCSTAYHFHHKDKNLKEFDISRCLSRSFERLLKEALKCQLLCSNCHSELHDKEYLESMSNTVRKWNQATKEAIIEGWISRKPTYKQTHPCKNCHSLFEPRYKSHQYCSRQCRIDFFIKNSLTLKKTKVKKIYVYVCGECSKDFESDIPHKKFCSIKCSNINKIGKNRKVPNRPSKEDLESMLSTMTWTSIGQQYGVSDNTIRKWAKGYGIVLMPRKYNRKLIS